MNIKREKKADVVFRPSFNESTGKVTKKLPWMRTCNSCGENLYSRKDFVKHCEEEHGKKVAKAVLTDTRVVTNSIRKARIDVPEEVLVRSKKTEKPKATVAKSRRGRQKKTEVPAEPTATAPQQTTEEPAKAKRRGRRKKSETKES